MTAEPDSRNSLRHILANDPVEETLSTAAAPPPSTTAAATTTEHGDTHGDAAQDDTQDHSQDGGLMAYSSTTQTTRRNANGTVSSVYSGNKIKHLKKEDGIPLWRRDIQYEFLQLVFDDQQRVFTMFSDGSKGHTFADIYIDAMSKSSKTSKILKEKLAADRQSAVSMAMVCLLVNVGRMNTTLNFFPEMRAQLRTYHSIPALQAHQDPNAYKQLQDAPRLKSILKGATEDEPQPGTIEEIKTARVPRTNPVNLIFVLSQYAPKISEVHFSPPRDFFDLVMRGNLSSKSRATAFLWLLWWYLESNFSKDDALQNPFGPGHDGENTAGLPIKVPPFEVLTEEQAMRENIDTEEERVFGEMKRRERLSIMASEPSPAMTALKRARKERSLQQGYSGYSLSDNEGTATPSREFRSPVPQGSAHSNPRNDYDSDEHSRSPSPPTSSFQAVNVGIKPVNSMNITNMLSNEEPPPLAPPQTDPLIPAVLPPPEKKKGPGRGNWRRNKDQPPTPLEPLAILPHPAQHPFVHESPAPTTPGAASHSMPWVTGSSVPRGGESTTPAANLSPVSYTTSQRPKLAAKHNSASGAGASLRKSNGSSGGGGGTGIPSQPSYARAHSYEQDQEHVPTPSYQSSKRSRPLTTHQAAITEYRRSRISSILERQIRSRQRQAARARVREGALLRAWKRIRLLPSGWDSDEEEGKLVRETEKREEEGREREEKASAGTVTTGGTRGGGAGGAAAAAARDAAAAAKRPVGGVWMAGFVMPVHNGVPGEEEDVGEEAREYRRAFGRVVARFERWDRSSSVLLARTTAVAGRPRDRLKRRRSSFEYAGDGGGMEVDNGGGGNDLAGERPRLKRAAVGTGSRKAKSAAKGANRNVKAEHPARADEDDMDVDGGGVEAELDDEDRELLGEVDADESDEVDDEDDDDDEEMGADDG